MGLKSWLSVYLEIGGGVAKSFLYTFPADTILEFPLGKDKYEKISIVNDFSDSSGCLRLEENK